MGRHPWLTEDRLYPEGFRHTTYLDTSLCLYNVIAAPHMQNLWVVIIRSFVLTFSLVTYLSTDFTTPHGKCLASSELHRPTYTVDVVRARVLLDEFAVMS